MATQIFHFSNTGISSGQRFYLKDDVSGIFVRNLNIDSNFPVVGSNLVYNTGNQTISGIKTFASRPTVNGTGVLLIGEVANVTLPATIVYTTGNQTISGVKNFSEGISFQDNLLYYSQPSGYTSGSLFVTGLSGNRDGGYFIGSTKLSQNTNQLIDESFGNSFKNIFTGIAGRGNYAKFSSDGEYIISTEVQNGIYGVPNDALAISYDFGNTWKITRKEQVDLGEVAISADGKYQIVCNSSWFAGGGISSFNVSNDYGDSFRPINIPGGDQGVGTPAISADGKYQKVRINTNQKVFLSNDYGDTWSFSDLSPSPSLSFWDTQIAGNGKYQAIITANYTFNQSLTSGQILLSNNYGSTWNYVNQFSNTNFTPRAIALSDNGKMISVASESGVYISNDYGKSYTLSFPGDFTPLSLGIIDISMSADGKYQALGTIGSSTSTPTGRLFVSTNYGSSWSPKLVSNSFYTVDVSSNGKYLLVGTLSGVLLSKTDEKIDGNFYADNLVYNAGNQIISGNKIFNSLRIEPSGRAFNIGTGLNINSESGIVRINTNVSSSLGAGFTYALTSAMDPNRPLDIEGRGRLVHGLSLDAGSNNFTSASDHFHLFFSAGPSNPGSFNGRYSTDTNTNYKSYQFSPTTRPNGNDNLRDLIHLTTLEAKGAGDQTFPTSNLTELYLTTTGTTVVTPPGTGLVELAYAINSQPTSQYLHSTGDLVYLRVLPGVAGIVANTYNGTVATRATGLDPAYGSTNVYKVGIALGALNVNNNFVPAQRGTSTQTDAWTLTRSTPSNAFTGITRIERNSSQYLDQFNVFYTSPITGYTGESVVVDVFNRGAGTFIASGITLTQARYDGYVSKVLSPTGLEITLSVMNFGSLGGVGRPGAFHNPPLTTGSAFISSEDLITGMKILRGSSDSVHRNYWAHNVFAGFRNLDANQLNVPAGVITRVAAGGLNRVENASTSAFGFNNKAYGFNSHAYGAHQENYNRDSVRIGATNESYINIVSGKLGVNVVSPSATIDIGTGNLIAGAGIFDAIDLNNIDSLNLSGVDISITNGNVSLTNRPTVNGTGVLLIGEASNSNGNLSNNQILNTTYSNLTGLKAISGLLSGQLYRISDFVLKWNNQSINDQTVKTAASGEPLIVTALSNKQIYHIAQSEIYPQDTIYYNIDASGSYSWGVINTNVAIPDFKGWIYRRVDNLLNIDIPYDWRNITVNCCKPDVSSVPYYFPNVQYNRLDYVIETGNINRGKLYYSVATGNSGNSLNNSNFWNPVSYFVESGTYFATSENYGFRALYDDFNFGDFIINLPALTSSRIQQPTFTSTLTGLGTFTLNSVKNVKIEGGYNNVIIGNNFYSNKIGGSFYNNTISDNFYINTIDNNFNNNVIGGSFGGNTFSNGFTNNTIAQNFVSNKIDKNFSHNTIADNFVYNIISNNFYSNAIGSTFNSNIIGNGFSSNSIGKSFSTNTIGNGFSPNSIGNSFSTNTIGNSFYLNAIGNSFGSNTIGNNFYSNAIENNFNSNTIGNYFHFNTIGNLFEVNTIGNFFYSNTISNFFFGNTAEGEFNGVNFSTSTHVYNSTHNKTLFSNSAGSKRLRYFNSNDQLVVTDPTA